MSMTEDKRPKRETVVDVLVPIDIPQVRTPSPLHKQRVGGKVLDVGDDAGRESLPGTLAQLSGCRCLRCIQLFELSRRLHHTPSSCSSVSRQPPETLPRCPA